MSSTPQPIPPAEFSNSPYPPNSGNTTLKLLLIIAGVVLVAMSMLIGLLLLMLYPAVQQVREAARRAQTLNQAQMLQLGLFNYEQLHGQFPPAFTTDENDAKLHSWRTLILPYLESASIYDSIDFDSPWNSTNNQPWTDRSLHAFISPRYPKLANTNLTSFVAVVGENTIINPKGGVSLNQLTPFNIRRIGIFLEIPNSDIAWAEPRDITVDEAVNIIQSYRGPAGLVIAMADGSTHTIFPNTSEVEIRKIFSTEGGTTFPDW